MRSDTFGRLRICSKSFTSFRSFFSTSKVFRFFRSFSKFLDLFGPVRMHSDASGCVRMHSDAFGRPLKRQVQQAQEDAQNWCGKYEDAHPHKLRSGEAARAWRPSIDSKPRSGESRGADTSQQTSTFKRDGRDVYTRRAGRFHETGGTFAREVFSCPHGLTENMFEGFLVVRMALPNTFLKSL